MTKKKSNPKQFVDPNTKRKVGYDKILKIKNGGINVIVVVKGKNSIEYDYDLFAKANPNFKSKLSG